MDSPRGDGKSDEELTSAERSRLTGREPCDQALLYVKFGIFLGTESAPMEPEKKQRLQASGWKVGTAQDFLDLSAEEALLVDIKARLAVALWALRQKRNLTQAALAKRLASSQSRVAKMEAGDRSVSLELLIRSLVSLGATRQELAKVIGRK